MTFDEIQFGFMHERGTFDTMFFFGMLQEEYHVKGKTLCMCFVDLWNAFDRVPRKVLLWAMRNKGMPDVLVTSVMSLYEGAKT